MLTRYKTRECSLVPLVKASTSVMEASEFNVSQCVHFVWLLYNTGFGKKKKREKRKPILC